MRTKLLIAAPVALAMATGAGCDPGSEMTQATPEDIKAAQAVVEIVTENYGVTRPQPARVVLGTWNAIAEANAEWSDRLAMAMRDVAERAYHESPEAPRLLRIMGAKDYPNSSEWDGYIEVMVIDKESEYCCASYLVEVRLEGNDWQIHDDFMATIHDFSFPNRVIEDTEAFEMRFRSAGVK